MTTRTCSYVKKKEDGYRAVWRTECGEKVICEGPIDVGFCPNPLPTEGGKEFCSFCGGKIELGGGR